MKALDVLLCLLVMILWGSQVTGVKIVSEEIPLFTILLIRFSIISAFLFPFMNKVDIKILCKMAIISLFSTSIHFFLLYQGIALIPAATSAVIYQLTPIFTIILSALILGDNIKKSSILGISVAFVGIIFMFGGIDLKANIIGGIFVTLAAFSFSIGTVLTKKLGPFDPISMNCFSAIFSIPFMLTMALAKEGNIFTALSQSSVMTWLVLLYVALSGGVIGFAIWYHLLNRYAITTLSPYTLLIPLFAVSISESLLHEGLNLHFILSSVTIIIGVAMTQINFTRHLNFKK